MKPTRNGPTGAALIMSAIILGAWAVGIAALMPTCAPA